jgi:hypothetical protein
MKKVLLAFDGVRFSKGAFEFARRLNDIEPVLLSGVFLPQIDLSVSWSYAAGNGSRYIPPLEPFVSEKVTENIYLFESLCDLNNIEYSVHQHFLGQAMPELEKESRFADLLILGGEKFFESGDLSYLTDMLHDTACPVVVVPERFNFPGHIVLAYDGSAAATFAIKQFACLFPGLCGLKTTLVYRSAAEKPIPDLDYIEELAARHFSNLQILKLKSDTQEEFNTWLRETPDAMLVTGSFSRNLFSEVFKRSFSEQTIYEHIIPVFIAHK